jgi:RAB protein geranylgeranyltransferase component A
MKAKKPKFYDVTVVGTCIETIVVKADSKKDAEKQVNENGFYGAVMFGSTDWDSINYIENIERVKDKERLRQLL